jgi:ABC-type uncharacterized transport system involved in gliding motility auxiliary subunit
MSTKEIRPAKGKTAAEALITGVAAAAALVLLNVLSCGTRAKVDLTENKIYSLSDASKSLVRGMKERVNVRAYFGNVPPEYAEKVTYVDMLLSEYADAAAGKIDYQRIDPWDKPELQEELRKDGVDKLRLQSLKDDSFQQVPMYFHVVFTHLDKKEVWTPAQGFNLEGLEYEFTTRVKRLGYGKKKVGITTGFGEPRQAQALQAPGADVLPGVKVGLGDLYDVQMVDWAKDPKSLDGVDVLIVNGPTAKVSDSAKFHLDQLIMHGKAVLFFVGGMQWQSGGGQQQFPGMEQPDQPFIGMPGDNGLGDLLASYGFQVAKDVVLDAKNTARMWLPPGARQGMLALGFAPFAEALANGPRDILAHIDIVPMPFASSLTLTGGLAADKRDADTQVIELLRTAPTSFDHTDVLAITRDFKGPTPKERKPFLVAAAAAAKFKSFYADHPAPANVDLAVPGAPGPVPGDMMPDPDDGEADPPAPPASQPVAAGGPLRESAAHTRIAVVASPTLAADQTLMDVQRTGEIVFVNGFVATHNLVDWLAEDTALIAVRGKKVERPLEKLDNGQRAAVKYANVVGAPLLLTIVGIVTWRVRERRRRNIAL